MADDLASILEEFALLQSSGSPPDLEVFCNRYPQHLREAIRESCQDLIALDRFIEESVESPDRDERINIERIGHYRIIERIGEGGMGVVFRAEQREPVRRIVALKLIRPGLDSKQILARFEAERQALALMNHPNIAQVFDAGTEDGRPYFVMEYIPGIPITEYCDTHRLKTADRIDLFLKVCDAVQHAHQKGIIHRDLKPTNILVTPGTDVPVPKIIDFGVAKDLDHRLSAQTLFTMTGQLVGTPEYMAPEQSGPGSRDIDTRADVYSLGVLLYELLVGKLPWVPGEGHSPAELRESLYSVDPTRPSTLLSEMGDESRTIAAYRRTNPRTLSRELKGDLDWITLRAMEKDRTRRYASASELAADIQRHLDGEPVLAGPPSTWYRIQKFARRNRVFVTSALAVSAALLVGLIVSWHLYLETRSQALVNEELLEEKRGLLEQLEQRVASDVELMAHLGRVRDLEQQAEKTLWPPYADRVQELESWLDHAEKELASLPGLRRALQEIRLESLTITEAEYDARRKGMPQYRERERLQEMLAQWDEKAPMSDEVRFELAAARRRLEDLDDEIEGFEIWRFSDPDDQWRHDTLAALVAELDRWMSDDEAVSAVASIRNRLVAAHRMNRIPRRQVEEAWAKARKAIREHPLYSGLEIDRQPGLLPLGPDPDSTLWEFAHLISGEVPGRDPAGHIVIEDDSAIVLVLIPGGRDLLGSQGHDPRGPNYDQRTRPNESEPFEIELSPFFLSKFELTQGQWFRLTSTHPSPYGPNHERTRDDWARHPVEYISFDDCQSVLGRNGLALPTECQWEYATRAGTDTPWWTGEQSFDLQDVANLADESAANENPLLRRQYERWNDGHFIHSTVGEFRANPFGLHDVYGNVAEICRDRVDQVGVSSPLRVPGDGESILDDASKRIMRGGNHASVSGSARSAFRLPVYADFRAQGMGVRPSRSLDRD
ncbi:MAG: protein kinase [Planctomycetota bacterium]